MFRRLWRILIGIVVAVLVVPLSINALSYVNFESRYGFLRLKQEAVASGWYLPAYYSHVLIAAVILLAGTFQVFPRWSLRWPRVHRALGRTYAYGIFFFAAPGGLVMSFFIDRGPIVLSSFILQTLAWVITTALAIRFIRAGKRTLHAEWMMRSYAITFAAVTLRLYTFIFSWSYDLSQPAGYEYISWLSWVLNLMVVEIVIRVRRKTQVVSSK